ncbi:hypothetical protein R1sor_015723 [Riccia sorocarpa]|uniref:BTB domain-containing protein n=1 Tax=Riccia sorocarpa TaxID=122646 RepID=A0ABD3HG22_9MARC
MVDNVDFSDVTFVCEDGVSVHGCRSRLAARSFFFERLLLGGMKESESAIVQLPSLSSSVLILLDWNFLVKAVVAARFFMLDVLEKIIIDRLQGDLPQHTEGYPDEDSLIELATRLSLLHAYPDLWMDEGIEAICSSIAADLKTHDLSPATLSHLSEAAFHSYLEKTQDLEAKGLETRASFLNEYLRLRQILTWCVVSTSSPENLDRRCLPGPEVALDLISCSEDESLKAADELACDCSLGRTGFISRISMELLQPLLKFVDFSCIPIELLCNVIEPLDIIKPRELARIFRAHAMRKSTRRREDMDDSPPNMWHMLVGKEDTWRTSTEDKHSLTFTVRRETSSFKVAAIAGLVMRTCKPLEWKVSVISHGAPEEGSIAEFEFGFITLDYGDAFPQDSIGPLSTDPRCSAVRIGGNFKSAQGFSQGKCIQNWNIEPHSFSCSTPLTVIVNRDKVTKSSASVAKYGNKHFSFFAPKNKLVYPAIYLRLGESAKRPFRPHYDQFTVKLENIVGHDNLVVVKS